jgi:hypothetical protein
MKLAAESEPKAGIRSSDEAIRDMTLVAMSRITGEKLSAFSNAAIFVARRMVMAIGFNVQLVGTYSTAPVYGSSIISAGNQ